MTSTAVVEAELPTQVAYIQHHQSIFEHGRRAYHGASARVAPIPGVVASSKGTRVDGSRAGRGRHTFGGQLLEALHVSGGANAAGSEAISQQIAEASAAGGGNGSARVELVHDWVHAWLSAQPKARGGEKVSKQDH
jgi:hypothetical protein